MATETESAGKEVLAEVVERVTAELTQGATQLREKGQTLQAAVQQRVTAAQEGGVGAKLQQALQDLSPLQEAEISSRKGLEDHAFAGVTLAAMEAGEIAGRLLGGLLLGYVISPAIAAVTTLVVLPASFLAYDQNNSPSSQDRHTALALLGLLSGVLHGFALRNYNLASIHPECLTAVLALAVSRYGAGPLSKQGDRTALLGAMAGARVAVYLGMDILLGTLTAASILSLASSTAAFAAVLQLSYANARAPGLGVVEAGQADAMLGVAALLPTLALDYVLAPIAGAAAEAGALEA